jgi:hypothetical protein
MGFHGRWLAVMLLTTFAGRSLAASPCTRNANAAERSCRRLCGIADKLDRAACFPRDASCVTSCRIHLDGCRETGGVEYSFLACAEEFEGARLACVALYSDETSPSFSACLDQARQDAVQCRSEAVRIADTRFCRDQFDACRRNCAPGSLDVQQCRATALADHQKCLTRCAVDVHTASTLCGDRGTACVSQCDGDLDNCGGHAFAPEGFRACKSELLDATQACRLDPATRDACFAAAKFAFFGCVGPFEDSAAAAFVDCDLTYDGCIEACPLP